jgi:phytoene desaturase
VLSPVPHLQSGTDWQATAEPYRKAIEQRLQATLLPNLSHEIVSSHMLTPQDFQDRLSSFRGAAFGLEPVLTQSAWFRPHNRSEELKNLYLVGAGTHPGAGLPGVLSSARVLDSVVPHADILTSALATPQLSRPAIC